VAATSPDRQITFLFDVDNTLIDNDQAKKGLSRRIGEVLGADGEQRFWEMYEEIRRETGLVNIPLILSRYSDELAADPSRSDAERRRIRFELADAVMNFPYRNYLYPGAIEAIRRARHTARWLCSRKVTPRFSHTRSGRAVLTRKWMAMFWCSITSSSISTR